MPRTYATWNNADKGLNYSLDGTSLIATLATSAVYSMMRANQGKSSGTHWWDLTMTSGCVAATHDVLVGIALSTANLAHYIGQAAGDGFSYYQANGHKKSNGVDAVYGSTYTDGDTIGFGLNMDAGTLEAFKLVTGAMVSQGILATGLTGTFYPAISGNATVTATVITARFGASGFPYTVPSPYNTGVYTGEDTSIPVIMNQYRQRRN